VHRLPPRRTNAPGRLGASPVDGTADVGEPSVPPLPVSGMRDLGEPAEDEGEDEGDGQDGDDVVDH